MHHYEHIENYLLGLINSGELKEGDRIPNEVELAERFSVSRPTVRQALSRLTIEGQITRIKGKGSYVAKPKLTQESTRFISSYRDEAARKGFSLLTNVIELERVLPKAEIAKALELSENEMVVKLSRLRFLQGQNNDKPVLYTTVYLSEKLCPGIIDCNFENVSLYEALEGRGLKIEKVHREIEIRTADKRLERLLGVTAASPLFFVASKGYINGSKPLEYSESWYPSESTKFIVEING